MLPKSPVAEHFRIGRVRRAGLLVVWAVTLTLLVLVCAFSVTLWVRSYGTLDTFGCVFDRQEESDCFHRGISVQSARGIAEIHYSHGVTAGTCSEGGCSTEARFSHHGRADGRLIFESLRRNWYETLRFRLEHNPSGFAHGLMARSAGRTIINFPLWCPVVLGTGGLVLVTRGWRRRRRRRRAGLCVFCGYDLTGNDTGVCSECGEAMRCG